MFGAQLDYVHQKNEFENLKSFRKFSWQLSDTEDPAGWHVLLGDNGAGKSTFIKAVALALMGTDEANKTRQNFANWVRKGQDAAYIRLDIAQDEEYDLWIDIDALSDGYRSILSMILELIRQMSVCSNTSSIFDKSQTTINFPGVIFMTHTKPTSSTSQRGSSTFSPRMTTDRRVIICVADIPCAKPNFGISTPLARVNFSFKMLSEGFDAATAGYHVGYGTAAQFTRVYKRLFGTPPRRDIKQLRETAAAGAAKF